MGVTITDNDEQVTGEMSASKPKERQFQVVPVPGTFTRGRWKCWDYKEISANAGEEVIDFTDKNEKTTAATVAIPKATLITNTEQTLNHTVSEPRLLPPVETSAGPTISQPIDVPVVPSESTTILVTSIAPASLTPVQGTPSSYISPPIDDPPAKNNAQNVPPVEVINGANSPPTVSVGTIPATINVPSTPVPPVTLPSGQIPQPTSTLLNQQVGQQDTQNETTRAKASVTGQALNASSENDEASIRMSAGLTRKMPSVRLSPRSPAKTMSSEVRPAGDYKVRPKCRSH